ncbi:EamA/RhaT family transporter [Apibacter muscae]|uniref:EamA family transporter n=1 Tax=Apibacter muscae TaxID=2509004 RepID=UPI0011AD933F|nr:EamA family transporter [Apibacter muscae]TWP22738.1 EamA/RhaT family transporter [Apibacter muscae]
MIEIIISVIFNVAVSIILKIYSTKNNSKNLLFQIITYNYLFSAILCYLIFKPDIFTINFTKIPWGIYILMSILMPSLFLLIGQSIKYIGIAKTDIAQRISLLLTIIASFVFFNESFHLNKVFGLCIGFISIFFIFYEKINRNKAKPSMLNKWYLPLLIFLGMGMVSILYKIIAIQNSNISFITSTFIIFIGSFIFSVILIIYRKQKFNLSAIFWGLGVGIFNFGNVLFYLRAHQTLKDNPSIVFATMNLGVIVFGSIVGIIFFKEKMSKLNYWGLLLALISIVLISKI